MASLFDSCFSHSVKCKIINALCSGNADAFKSLLEQAERFVQAFRLDKEEKATSSKKRTIVADFLSIDLLEDLFKKEITATSNGQCEMQGTLLQMACSGYVRQSVDIVKYLVEEKGFDFNAKNSVSGKSAFELSMEDRRFEIANYLLKKGAMWTKEIFQQYLFGEFRYQSRNFELYETLAEKKIVDFSKDLFVFDNGSKKTYTNALDCFFKYASNIYEMSNDVIDVYKILKKCGADPKACTLPLINIFLTSVNVKIDYFVNSANSVDLISDEDLEMLKSDGFSIGQVSPSGEHVLDSLQRLFGNENHVKLTKEQKKFMFDRVKKEIEKADLDEETMARLKSAYTRDCFKGLL